MQPPICYEIAKIWNRSMKLICFGKVHNCLIDNWAEMKSKKSVNKTIIYDVCSIYGYGR